MFAPYVRSLLLGIATIVFALPAAAQTGTISGRVTEAGSDKGIIGATARAVSGVRTAGNALTDENGNFRISGVPEGTYSVVVTRIGYKRAETATVSVGAGASANVTVSMEVVPTQLQEVITAASRAPEKVIDAPAAVSVVTAVEVNERPSINVADHVAALPGIDVARGGLMRSNIVARGFNNIFSGAMLTLVDNRFAFVPSLRVNIPYLNPTTNEDIERIEVVLGPGSALYGPNATSGVLAIVTKSPFESQGTTLTIDGGNQSVLRGSFRTAWAPTQKFGVKLTYDAFKGREWPTYQGDPALKIPPDTIREQKPRDLDLNRQGGEVRVDFRPTPGSEIIANYGRSKAGNAVEPTGLGPAQVKDWVYQTAQLRGRYKQLFAQVFMNTSDAGGTYLLRTVGSGTNCPNVTDPACIIDKSKQLVGQLQHGFTWTRERLLYGFDYIHTEPITDGTINGRNEGDDIITETGGYIHSVTTLSQMFELTAAARLDKSSRLADAVFSPRVALVFKPAENHNFRLTYNRAFSTPSTLNLFLDLLGTKTPLFDVRALGVPEAGLHFKRDCATGLGSLCMRAFTAFGGTPGSFLPADASLLYPYAFGAAKSGIVSALTASFQAAGLPAAIAAGQANAVAGFLGTLRPTAAQVGTKIRILQTSNGTFTDVAPTDLRDVERIKPEIHTTIEGGYKGIIANRLQLSLDAWHENRKNFVGPLLVETPNVFLDAATLAAYLTTQLTPVVGPSFAGPIAAAVAGGIGGVSGTANTGVPVGVVNFDNPLSAKPEVIVTYRNFGNLDYWGSDLGAELLLDRGFSVTGTYSYVNKKLFPKSEVGGVSDISLNAPASKHSFAVNYRDEAKGMSAELRERHVDGYRAVSFIDGQIAAYTLVDASFSIRPAFLNDVMLSLSGTNLLDKKHQEFVQGGVIGRLIMTRLQVTF
jgi:outer membrane receptor for ferrienterochelin and colicins